MAKFLPLMRVGVFRDRHGGNYDITRDVLKNVEKNFDAAKPPMLLIGHPDKKKPPVLGFADALKFVKDVLYFRPARYMPEFEKMVRRGVFPAVSAGLTKALDRLDHIAFLSAQSPAIDGLTPITEFSSEFESDDIDVTEVAWPGLAEFGADESWTLWKFRAIGDVLRGIKSYITEKSGAEEADRVIPEYDIETINREPPAEEADPVGEFSVPVPGDAGADDYPPSEAATDYRTRYNELMPQFEKAVKTVATIEKANAELTAANAALVGRVEELKKSARLAEFGAWVEERIAEGRILPDRKAERVANMENLFQGAGAEFSKDPVNLPYALDIYKKDIMALPCRTLTAGLDGAQFASGGRTVNSGQLTALARAYMSEQAAKGAPVSSGDAVMHVMNRDGLVVVP